MRAKCQMLGLLALLGLCGCVLTPPRSTKAPVPQRTPVSQKNSTPVAQATSKREPTPQKIEPEPVERERVATLELINKAGLPREEVSYLSKLVRQAAGRLPQSQYGVITKDNIMVMLPQGKTLEDCQTECAVQTGREIGAHWIVTGEVIKFGGELRVSVSLHHSASGELRGSDIVKGKDVKELEGPLQGAAIGLFGTLDPSLKRVAERLKRGVVFEKVTLSALPELPKLEAEAEVQEERLPSVALPSAAEASAVKGVDFGKMDVEGLQLYDKALSTDEDPKVEPQEKIRLWEQVMARVGGTEQLAVARIEVWRVFLAEQARVEAERQRRAEEARRRAAELERRRKQALAELNQVEARDAAQERERKQKMERDWEKLAKLLPLRVVSEEDKLSWVEAFLEAYSGSAELNPHMRDPLLSRYNSKLGARLSQFKAEGEAELARRKRRAHEIEQKRCEIETGVEGETCLREREHYYTLLGSVVTELRYQEVIQCYRQATEKNDTSAQRDLGFMYEKGRGVKQDDKKAFYWYQKAAEQGSAYAQYLLGSMYEKGRGVTQDKAKSFYWYQKAAEQNNLCAMYDLGYMHRHEKKEAIYWYKRAIDLWSNRLESNLDHMCGEGISIKQEDDIFDNTGYLSIAKEYEIRGQWGKARKAYVSHMKNHNQIPFEVLRTHLLIAESIQKEGLVGSRKSASEELATAWLIYKGISNEKKIDEDMKHIASRIRFLEAEYLYQDFKDYKIIPFPQRELVKTFQSKYILLQNAQKMYLEVLSLKSYQVSVGAFYRIADLYDNFAKSLSELETPSELKDNPSLIDMHKIFIEEKVIALMDKALEAVRGALSMAYENQVYNEWLNRSAELLLKIYSFGF